MTFIEWLLSWQPEHIIALITALGIGGIAAKIKGAAKPAIVPPPPVIGELQYARLETNDRAALYDIKRDVAEVRSDISDLARHMTMINEKLVAALTLLDRLD